jgi:hypothetical protein
MGLNHPYLDLDLQQVSLHLRVLEGRLVVLDFEAIQPWPWAM